MLHFLLKRGVLVVCAALPVKAWCVLHFLLKRGVLIVCAQVIWRASPASSVCWPSLRSCLWPTPSHRCVLPQPFITPSHVTLQHKTSLEPRGIFVEITKIHCMGQNYQFLFYARNH